jgi:hypothetical protein
MSLSEQTMLDLMAYADGELDGSANKRIEKLVARDAEARKVLDAMQTLTECVQISSADRPAPAFDVDGIVDSVMKTVSTLPVPKDEERPIRLLRAGTAAVVSALIAIAASYALFAPDFAPSAERDEGAEVVRQALAAAKTPPPPEPPPVVAVAEPVKPPVLTEPGGVELDHVESPSHEVSVFYVPALAESLTENGDNAATSVVVWIGDNQRGL